MTKCGEKGMMSLSAGRGSDVTWCRGKGWRL